MMNIVPKLEITANIKRCSSSAIIDLEISNFNLISPKNAREFTRISSLPFSMGDNIGLNSEWRIYAEGMDGNLGCFIELTSSPQNQRYLAKGIRIKYSMGIGSSRNRFLVKCGQYEPLEGIFNQENRNCGYKSFAELFDLHKKARTHLENNTLRICVEMEIESGEEDDDVEKILRIKSLNRLEKLSQDLGQFSLSSRNSQDQSSNQNYSDVTIKCGDIVYSCHKLILAARSKVFNTMFGINMTEAGKNEIVMNDMTPPTLSALLQYIYTGQVTNPMTSDVTSSFTWTELVDAAEKYDLQHLKDYCLDKMIETLTIENVGLIAMAAQTYGASAEQTKCIHKFCVENITTLVAIPSFKEILINFPGAIFGNKCS